MRATARAGQKRARWHRRFHDCAGRQAGRRLRARFGHCALYKHLYKDGHDLLFGESTRFASILPGEDLQEYFGPDGGGPVRQGAQEGAENRKRGLTRFSAGP
jgi:hypothetical protein